MRIMNDQDTFAFENREYVSPTVSRDEQLGFIDNLRDVRNQNIERINADTYNLGTQVPSIRGGLGGSNATFESRYVTPYVNSTIQGLKTAAQQTALTQALENLQAQYKQRYNEAYKAAQKRAAASGGGGGDNKWPGNGDEVDPTKTNGDFGIINSIPGTIWADTGAGITVQKYENGKAGDIIRRYKYGEDASKGGNAGLREIDRSDNLVLYTDGMGGNYAAPVSNVNNLVKVKSTSVLDAVKELGAK